MNLVNVIPPPEDVHLNVKTVTAFSSGSFTPTAVNKGLISDIFGIPGLTQDRVVSIMAMQGALNPASNFIFGMYSNYLYVSTTINTTLSGTVTLTLLYTD